VNEMQVINVKLTCVYKDEKEEQDHEKEMRNAGYVLQKTWYDGKTYSLRIWEWLKESEIK
jgi:hypothetical protein